MILRNLLVTLVFISFISAFAQVKEPKATQLTKSENKEPDNSTYSFEINWNEVGIGAVTVAEAVIAYKLFMSIDGNAKDAKKLRKLIKSASKYQSLVTKLTPRISTSSKGQNAQKVADSIVSDLESYNKKLAGIKAEAKTIQKRILKRAGKQGFGKKLWKAFKIGFALVIAWDVYDKVDAFVTRDRKPEYSKLGRLIYKNAPGAYKWTTEGLNNLWNQIKSTDQAAEDEYVRVYEQALNEVK